MFEILKKVLIFASLKRSITKVLQSFEKAFLAQLDRASDYGSEG